jgi:UDP-N-acetylglucosamine 2-epimerase (non-hydrolysing)
MERVTTFTASFFKHIILVAGARPNFMKVAPLMAELRKRAEMFGVRLIHTGQHYDTEMSEVFFRDLDLPQPNRFLGVGSGSHAEQTAKVMIAFEQVCIEERPDLVVVVGDVNSTMACAIAAKKLGISVAHIEAGLRSRDWTMPEEINRVVTDAISDLLFTPSRDADSNLSREGVLSERIHFVGNVMIDSLLAQLPKTEKRDTLGRFRVDAGQYATLTLHRPTNVDDPEVLGGIVEVMIELSQQLPIIWPVHPRSRKMLDGTGLASQIHSSPNLRVTEPLGYLDMLTLNRHARVILTDSGGLQEEAVVLGIPCITLRQNTERPITLEVGANQLAGNQPSRIRAAIKSILNYHGRTIRIPERWDGKAAARIVDVLIRLYTQEKLR